MAELTTSNLQNTGMGGGRRLITGEWTGSLGDPTATITVEGRMVYGAQLLTNDSGFGSDVPITWTATSGIITVTVAAALAVTDGTFFLIVA